MDYDNHCPVCGSRDIEIFLQVKGVPVHCNLIWKTRETAILAPKGDLTLGYCGFCYHIFNLAFSPTLMEYTGAYENSLHFSPTFQDYSRSLAGVLVEKHALRGKKIIEIGCGQGDFLKMVCDYGGNDGLGFDPSYAGPMMPTKRVKIIRDYFGEQYLHLVADFVCSRHVLEHIAYPVEFLKMISGTLGGDIQKTLFFEVPNGEYILKNMMIWDLIYEHFSYFNPASLARLFQTCGLEVKDIYNTFGAQFLCIEGRLQEGTRISRKSTHLLPGMKEKIEAFSEAFQEKISYWNRNLEEMILKRHRVVAWGSGSKGVTFLNLVENAAHIRYIVDINPRKQDNFVAGTGQEIIAPDFLREYKPDAILLMNQIYEIEIRKMVSELDLQPVIMVIG